MQREEEEKKARKKLEEENAKPGTGNIMEDLMDGDQVSYNQFKHGDTNLADVTE